MPEERYLGDGVFASFDGFHIVLKVKDGIGTTDKICLDDRVANALIRFIKEIFGSEDE